MRVLADFHHHALWESLRILFEERFGWELYRPTGMEWYEQELWNYERAQWGDSVAKQYLGRWDGDVDTGPHWERTDRKYPDQTFKMVTLDQFRALKWDFVVATLDHNEPAYAKLAEETGAQFVIEQGNQWGGHAYQFRPKVLDATTPNKVPEFCERVQLRQEFDIRTMFNFTPPVLGDDFIVSSFVNCYLTAPTYQRFLQTADFTRGIADFRAYTALCEGNADDHWAGDIEAVPDIAKLMKQAHFGWHDKRWSDGFGHVIHNWLALGRPPLVALQYYDGRTDGERKIVADLLVDGETCIDISSKSPADIAIELRKYYVNGDAYLRMCENAAKHFREVVDFDQEADNAHMMLVGEHAPVRVGA